MKYTFDNIPDRKNTYSLKWDIRENELPMWVADMDFETAPEIKEAIERRAAHGVFGYTIVPEEWNGTVAAWWEKRHRFVMAEDRLIFTTGVIPAVSTTVRKLTTPAEKVILMTPVYNTFYNSILNNGRVVSEAPFSYENGRYEIDWTVLEEKMADPQATLLILCNPHNPIGRIWDKNTLARIGTLSAKHHVTVLSDEIHCDLTDPDKGYIPFASVDETCKNNSITAIAPTKTFNLAGIQTAAVYIPNEALYHKIWRALNTDEVAEPNAFAMDAAIAAYTKGGPWLDALREYLFLNKAYVKAFIEENIPDIRLTESEATYLLWIDAAGVTADAKRLTSYLRKETGLWLMPGNVYGGNGQTFLRLNIATSRERIEDGMQRLSEGIKKYMLDERIERR